MKILICFPQEQLRAIPCTTYQSRRNPDLKGVKQDLNDQQAHSANITALLS